MAQFLNTTKSYNYAVYGLSTGTGGLGEVAIMVQKMTLPEKNIEKIPVGGKGITYNIDGALSYGELSFETLEFTSIGKEQFLPLIFPEESFTGQFGGVISMTHYAKRQTTWIPLLTVVEFGEDMITPFCTHYFTNCFVSKVNKEGFDRTSSASIMQKIDFTVNGYRVAYT
jgi:hypothetical protein